MRVAVKLALALLVCASAVLAVSAWLSLRRELSLLEEDMRRQMRGWGALATDLLRQVRADEGDAAARALVDRVSHPEDLLVRWVALDAEDLTPALLPAERARLRAGQAVAVQVRGDPGEIVTYVPLDPPGRPQKAALELRESLAAERAWIEGSVLGALASTLAMTALFGALAVVVGMRVVGRPVQELIALARRVGTGDLGVRLAVTERNELGELAAEMNAMCDRLVEVRRELEAESAARAESLRQLRHADRLATLGQFVAGMAHQLGTPLSVVQGRADLIAARILEAEEAVESGRVIGALTRRMADIVRQTLDYARRRPPELSEQDLGRLTRRMLDLLQDLARRRDVEVAFRGPPGPLLAEVDAAHVEQVITNLLVNAIQASPAGAQVEVEVAADRRAAPHDPDEPDLPRPLREVVAISVRDHGQGISPEHQRQLWDPFFTTKAGNEGTGLGLPIAKGIVEEHGGWLEVESEVGGGSLFRAVFPRSEGSPDEEAPSLSQEAPEA
ncbi:MAG: sensor histidine kinase [Planctomycetota bacterium]